MAQVGGSQAAVNPTVAMPEGFTAPLPTVALTDAATIAWPTQGGANNSASITLGGSRTMAAPTGLIDGGIYTLRIKQDATGSRVITWNAVFKWAAATAPTLTTTAAATDIIVFVSDGTNLYQVSVIKALA